MWLRNLLLNSKTLSRDKLAKTTRRMGVYLMVRSQLALRNRGG